jgi:hypothetical protein
LVLREVNNTRAESLRGEVSGLCVVHLWDTVYHFYLEQRIVAVIQEVLCFATVDSNNAEEELAA